MARRVVCLLCACARWRACPHRLYRPHPRSHVPPAFTRPAPCTAACARAQAAECRLRDEKAEKLAAALAAAETELARERLLEWQAAELAAPEEASGAGSRAMLQVLRLSQDELGFRCACCVCLCV